MLSNSTDGRRRAIAACHSFKPGYVIQAIFLLKCGSGTVDPLHKLLRDPSYHK
jgi:hypothetical protein